jgi:hypothetical protein
MNMHELLIPLDTTQWGKDKEPLKPLMDPETSAFPGSKIHINPQLFASNKGTGFLKHFYFSFRNLSHVQS